MAQGQWCTDCQFGKGENLQCSLFNQKRLEIGDRKQRLSVCLTAEEMAEKL